MKKQVSVFSKKNIMTRSSTDLSENFVKLPAHYVIRKELNIWGKMGLWGIYTLGIFLLAQHFTLSKQKASPQNLDQLVSKLDSIERKLDQGGATVNLMAQHDMIQKVENKMSQLLSERDLRLKSDLAVHRQGLHEFYQEVQGKELLQRYRRPAGSQDTVNYSEKEMTILRHEHRLEKEKFEKAQIQEKNLFRETHDLSVLENNIAWEELQEKHKMELYRLEQDQYEARKKFKTDQFRIVQN